MKYFENIFYQQNYKLSKKILVTFFIIKNSLILSKTLFLPYLNKITNKYKLLIL
jgi:hypothetical protein